MIIIMMYGYGFEGGWLGHTLFGGLFMIIIWVAVIFFVVWLIREASGSDRRHDERRSDGTTPLEILKERYAKGEIDKKEFDEKKRDLNG